MPIVDLVLPKLGESIMEATILKWHKKVGDSVQLDETILDIATDKVDSEIPSTVEGIITEILFEVNSIVPIGTVIAKIQTQQEIVDPITPMVMVAKEPSKQEENKVEEAPIEKEIAIPYIPANNESTIVESKFYSPLVMNIAQNEGVSMQELQFIMGTGAQGRITKKDIIAYITNKKIVGNNNQSADNQINNNFNSGIDTKGILIKPTSIYDTNEGLLTASINSKLANPAEVLVQGHTEILEMDRMRKLIAKHMVDSVQTSAHVTSFVEADVTNMVVWRDKVKQLFEKREGIKITFTPMFLECIASVLEQYPMINSSLQGEQIILKKDINIGMATALPTGNLIVPVIKGANQLSIVGLSKAVNNLAIAARNNQLNPQDTQGGTFTVTNVGTFGSLMGTPIINQPQVAILAIGAIKKRPVVVETPSGDAILVRHMMYISMSYDHRIVDGAMGSKFLADVAKAFEAWDVNRQWFQYL
jgi:2-oxoglutarate dehydrogenase E2 component (dihydrolipoamide succinyltransferase)